ncbi:MFS transporter [Agromyces sp. G08B096]|uniref:MFS transporter n=1 Tax=Agromyces sp. G08B096 TaxID=3156399 RepID=A0AAU7W9I0_9MICO
MTAPHPQTRARPPRPTAGLGGRTWTALVIIGLVGQLAWTVENMYLNVFVYDVITPQPEAIALMVASSAVAATVGAIIVGAWSDRSGRRRVFVAAGYVLWGACTAAFGLVGEPDGVASGVVGAMTAIIVLDCVMSFIGSGANDAAFMAWVTDSTTPSNRGRVDGMLAVLPLVAMLLVFGLLDGLTRAGDWGVFFAVVGALTAVAGGASLLLMRDRPVPRSGERVFASIRHGFRPSSVRRNPGLYLTLLTCAVIGTSSQVFLPYVIIYLQRYLRIEAYALVLGVVLIAASLLSILGGRVMDRVGKERFLLPSVGVFAAGLLAMPFAHEPVWVIAAATVMMTGMMASLATVNALVRDRTPAERAGAVQGLRMILGVMVPMILGPTIGAAVISGAGTTFEQLGVVQPVPGPQIFVAAAVVLLAGPAVWAWARRASA